MQLTPLITGAALVRTASVDASRFDAVQALRAGLGAGPFALVILFMAPIVGIEAQAMAMAAGFGETQVIGCSTAGEISDAGYAEGQIVAVGLPAAHFAADVLLVPDLGALDPHALIGSRAGLARRVPAWESEFAYLLVDGLSIREDELTSALASGLGPVPLFGGSAGGGPRVRRAVVLQGGEMHD